MRIIGEAGIRLTAEGEAGLARGFERETRNAGKAISGKHLLKDLDKNTDDDSNKIVGRLKKLGQVGLSSLGGLSKGATGAALMGGKLTLLATAAGAGLAAITSMVTGLIGFVGVAGQAAGVAGLLPAAFLGAKLTGAALQVALLGVSDAVSSLASGDLDKFDEQLKKLSPEAQKAIGSLRQFSPQIEKLKTSVQDNFFNGLGGSLKSFVGNYLPLVGGLFNGIAALASDAARETLGVLNSTAAKSQVSSIFNSIRASAADLGSAVAPAVQGLLSFFQVSASFLPQLTGGIGNLATRFRDFMTRAAASGQLANFFQTAINTAKELWGVVKDVGAGFVQIFHAAQIAGGGFLSNLKNMAAQFRAFTESGPGFNALITFFQSMRKVAGAVLPVITTLAQVVGADLAPILADIASVVGPALTIFLQSLGDALREARPGIQAFASGFAQFIKGIAPALPALGRLVDVLGTALGDALVELAPVVEQVAEVFADTLAETLPELIPPLVDLAKAFGDILVALAPVLPPLAKMAGVILSALAKILDQLGPPLADFIVQLVDELAPYIPPLVDAFLELFDAVEPLIKPLLDLTLAVLTPLLPLLGPIADLLSLIADILAPLVGLLSAVLGGLMDAAGGLVDFATNAYYGILGLASGTDQSLHTTFTKSAAATNAFLTDEQKKFLRTTDDIVSAFLGIPSKSSTAWTKIKDQAGFSFNGIVTDAGNAAYDIVAAFLGLPNSTQKAWTDLGNKAQGAWNKLSSGARSGTRDAQGSVNQMEANVRGVLTHFAATLFGSGQAATKGFADGMSSDWALLKAKAAAQRVVNAVSSFFPSSPAEVGPFSGRGWTPFRGQALVEGFAQGILSSTNAAAGATAALMAQVSGQLAAPKPLNTNTTTVSGTSSAASSGSQTVVNVKALPGMDVLQLGNYVMQQSTMQADAGGTSLPVSRQPVQIGVDDQFVGGVMNP